MVPLVYSLPLVFFNMVKQQRSFFSSSRLSFVSPSRGRNQNISRPPLYLYYNNEAGFKSILACRVTAHRNAGLTKKKNSGVGQCRCADDPGVIGWHMLYASTSRYTTTPSSVSYPSPSSSVLYHHVRRSNNNSPYRYYYALLFTYQSPYGGSTAEYTIRR